MIDKPPTSRVLMCFFKFYFDRFKKSRVDSLMVPLNIPWPCSGTTISRPSTSYVQLTNKVGRRTVNSPLSFSRFTLKHKTIDRYNFGLSKCNLCEECGSRILARNRVIFYDQSWSVYVVWSYTINYLDKDRR